MNLSSMLDRQDVEQAFAQNPTLAINVPGRIHQVVDVKWVPESNTLVLVCDPGLPYTQGT